MWRNGTRKTVLSSHTWCKFCIMDTHATQACRKYEKFVQDNPIASSRRNTPVQVQGQRVTVNPRDQPEQPQPLFPHPPVQRYNPTVIPRMQMQNVTPQREKGESREHSRKSPQHQMREVQSTIVTTISPSKELSGCPHGPTLPGTTTVCRGKLSPTLSTKASRSKRNWPYHPTGCDTTSSAEAYATY